MILLLDIGKTNKKCFVFDEDYHIVFEKSATLPETADEDGYPCEDLELLTNWVLDTVAGLVNDPRFQIRAINCTTYGASFVHLDAGGQALTPLYNYLKPFPDDLKKQFFETYGGETKMALETASPVLGNLNSGLQLYWLKHHKSLIFKQIKWSLHLPQYVAFLVARAKILYGQMSAPQIAALPGSTPPRPSPKGQVRSVLGFDTWKLDIPCWILDILKRKNVAEYPISNKEYPISKYQNPELIGPAPEEEGRGGVSRLAAVSGAPPLNLVPPTAEITSIGCHTMLWDFQKNDYHPWVKAEGITEKFPPLIASHTTTPIHQSTNPPIHHSTNLPIHQSTNQQSGIGLHDSSAALIPYLAGFSDPFVLISTGTWCISLNPFNREPLTPEELEQDCLCYLTYEGKPVKAARYFGGHAHDVAVKNLAAQFGVSEDFYKTEHVPANAAALSAYCDFMRQLVDKQVASTRLALGKSAVQRIFVDGGFSKNEYYMRLLAEAFPEMEVYAAEVAQATALGAALAIHAAWNTKPLPRNLIALKKY